MPPSAARGFAARLLDWFDHHGRRDLPWQQQPDAYRVWVSEVMLQQTQVETVKGFYRRFMHRFPGVAELAAADVDEVLSLWSGLGYYARGRNLHAAARRVVEDHGGRFPTRLEALMALPGIGRSTAGAILALSTGARHAILDGNVKRVLSRHASVPGWPGRRAVESRLWQEAEARLPDARVAAYTQAIMDLGATVCLPRTPACGGCPVRGDCRARIQGNPGAYPERKPRKSLPVRETVFVLARREDGALWLERRPPSGIWGGLWCFPESASDDAVLPLLTSRGLRGHATTRLPPLRHTFSHFHLDIQPLLVDVHPEGRRVADAGAGIWRRPEERDGIGLAAAVIRVLDAIPHGSVPGDGIPGATP
jgi:A/G-specific adenine glycosylase